LKFARHQFGKPYLPDHPEVHFNFSDTKDAILVGVSHVDALGVDVETMERELDHEAVAQHYFTDQEIEELMNADDPKARFLEFWTRKEAILKASGIGLMEDVRVLQVNKEEQVVPLSHADNIALSADQYIVTTGSIGSRNVLSVASASAMESIAVYDPLLL
jgi:4'-phosphopantetheinyl transferase